MGAYRTCVCGCWRVYHYHLGAAVPCLWCGTCRAFKARWPWCVLSRKSGGK